MNTGPVPVFGSNTSAHEFVLTGSDGTVSTYDDFTTGAMSGRVLSVQDPTGNVTLYSYNSAGAPTAAVRATTTGSVVTDERFVYNYGGPGGQLSSIILQRNIGGAGYAEVQETDYAYYSSGSTYGNPGQLQTVTEKDAGGAVTEANAYRYYTAGSGGPDGSLEYMFGDASYARLTAALGAGAPITASNAAVAPYADQYFTYNGQSQAAADVLQGQGCSSCSGGLGTLAYAYANNPGPVGYNDWSSKTTETLPDGTVDTDYYNAYGEQMLAVTTDATTGISDGNFTEYDSSGRAILTADPAAVEIPGSLSTLEAYPDLLNNVAGNYQYLADNAGEITVTNYAGTTTATGSTAGNVAGYVANTTIQNGETGTPIPQESMDYIARTAGGVTIYPIADDTTYGGTGGTDARTTSDAYTWYSGTTQMETQTVTLPVISSGQNGPGVADTTETFYDTYGRPIWDPEKGS